MSKKSFRGWPEIKSAAAGEIKCIFATMGVWDKDEDYTERGAFGRQSRIQLENWNHNLSLPPVGVGEIYEDANEAIFEGRFFLNTQAGREHWEIVKETLPEWSYTFDIISSRPAQGRRGRILKALDVIGVSPVTRGAGLGTRVLSISKSRHGPAADLLRAELEALETDPDLFRLQVWAEKNTGATADDLNQATAQAAAAEREIWYIDGLAQGHSLAYLQTIEAIRVEQARQADRRRFEDPRFAY